MKNGTVGALNTPDEKELELINRFTRKALSADEVYTFSVVLCDNEVDRDFEQFSVSTLKTLAELFVGKTGIFDHSQKGRDQCARVYFAELVKDRGTKTQSGESYVALKARAYMPRLESNRELIAEIDAGIKKEVSVGCSCAERVCSICGSSAGVCEHKKGRRYKTAGGEKLCFYRLEKPLDAYEWSFVAVPAQRNAGVTKAFSTLKEETMNIEAILKSIKASGGEVTLSAAEAACLKAYIDELEATAKSADAFLAEKKRDILRHCAITADSGTLNLVSAALERMNGAELFKLFSELDGGTARKKAATEPRAQTKPVQSNRAQAAQNSAFSL